MDLRIVESGVDVWVAGISTLTNPAVDHSNLGKPVVVISVCPHQGSTTVTRAGIIALEGISWKMNRSQKYLLISTEILSRF